MDYLSNSEDTPWTPDLDYYCSVIGRLVDSILLLGICLLYRIVAVSVVKASKTARQFV